MSNSSLNRICMDEEDPMVNLTVRCKHGELLPLLTSWSKNNPGRRFWACPFYGDNSCKFFRWRDAEIDPRSKFILPRLVNKFKEMEDELASIELNKKQLEMEEGFSKYKSFNKKTIEKEESLVNKMKMEKKNKTSLCCFNWKYVLGVIVVVFVWCMNSQMKEGKCKCSYLELP